MGIFDNYELFYKTFGQVGNKVTINFETENGNISMNVQVAEIKEYKGLYFIYANTNAEGFSCGVTPINKRSFLVIRNMHILVDEMGLTSSERNCVYYHELGHAMSPNQAKAQSRTLANEIDADTFAINKLGANPKNMKSALNKVSLWRLKYKKYPNEAFKKMQEETNARIKNIDEILHLKYNQSR